MTIRTKTLAVIAFSLIISVLVNFLILYKLVWPSFVDLEHKETIRNIERIRESIQTEIDDVSSGLWDYSSWDDTYAFAKNRNPQFPEIYLATDPLINMRMDLIELYDAGGERIFHIVFDRDNERTMQASWSLRSLDAQEMLFDHAEPESSISGIVQTPRGPLLIASRPIVKTSGEGPIAGTFFFGRFLDDRLVATLRRKIKVDFHVLDLAAVEAPQELSALKSLQESGESTVIEEASDHDLTAYSLLEDYQGRPILLIKANIARDVTAIGRRSLLASLAGVVLAGVVIMAVTGILLQWLLIGPLVNLTTHVVQIGRSGVLSRRLGHDRRDEIGILSREFDKMLASLEEARDRLLESSYQTGIAEMASGVLHNLRNQLTPLNMRVDRMREALAPSSDGKLDLALRELGSDAAAPDRKTKLLQYLALRFSKAAEEQCRLREELSNVSKDLGCVDSVLRELDRFSRAHMELEDLSLVSVVDRTVSALPTFPNVRITYEIDPNLQVLPAVRSASFVLSHVLNNLFMNAVEAIVAAGRTEGRIIVAGGVKQVDSRTYVDLQIQDNGCGIPQENLGKIFTRGFSTKNKQSGAGLHWSANRMLAMHGKIHAESAGTDQGATFHVLLPLADTLPKPKVAA